MSSAAQFHHGSNGFVNGAGLNAHGGASPNWQGESLGQFQSFDGKGSPDRPYQALHAQSFAPQHPGGDLIIIEAGKGNRKSGRISVAGLGTGPNREEKSPNSTSDLVTDQSEDEKGGMVAAQRRAEVVPLSPGLGF